MDACRKIIIENNRTDRRVLDCKYSDRIFTECRNPEFHKPYSSRLYFKGKNKYADLIVHDRNITEWITENMYNVVDYYL